MESVESSFVQQPYCVWKIPFQINSPGFLALIICLAPIPQCSLNPEYKRFVIDVSFGDGHGMVSCLLNFDQSWVSRIVYVCCKGEYL